MLNSLQVILPTEAPGLLVKGAAEKDFTTLLLTVMLLVAIAGIGFVGWAFKKYFDNRNEWEEKKILKAEEIREKQQEREDKIRREEKDENKATTDMLSKINQNVALFGGKLESVEKRVERLEDKVS